MEIIRLGPSIFIIIPVLHHSHMLKHAVVLDYCTLKHVVWPRLAVNLGWCCTAMLSFRFTEQLCSQHSYVGVRCGSPSVTVSADLVISVLYSHSAWHIQCQNLIHLLKTINSANVYHFLLNLLKFMSFCTVWLTQGEVFLIQANESWVKVNNHYPLLTDYIYVVAGQ